jgi:hypothetical protein
MNPGGIPERESRRPLEGVKDRGEDARVRRLAHNEVDLIIEGDFRTVVQYEPYECCPRAFRSLQEHRACHGARHGHRLSRV